MLEQNEDFKALKSAYPHIATRLELLWGSKECYELFDKLFLDTRDGERQGFAKDKFVALYRVAVLHDELFPQFVKSSHAWSYTS